MSDFDDFDYNEFEDIELQMDLDLSKDIKKDLSSDEYKTVSNHPLYKKLAGMLDRCNNPNNGSYKYWGAKGIKVFSDWNRMAKFANFYNWAIETGWKEGLELDRINPDKDYEPANLQWLNREEHALKTLNDQRRKHYYSDPGQTEIGF